MKDEELLKERNQLDLERKTFKEKEIEEKNLLQAKIQELDEIKRKYEN